MKKIAIIGAGTMGSIFLPALHKWQSNAEICVTTKTKERSEAIVNGFSFAKAFFDNQSAVQSADLVLFAVKPQSFEEISEELNGKIKSDAIILSIMAGIGLKKLQKGLGVSKIVRCMPNLGAKINQSMTVWTSTDNLNENEKTGIKDLLDCLGHQLYLENDEMIDKATAVSGSGPGFFFYLVEEWLRATEALGFSKKDAQILLSSTLNASNQLLQKDFEPERLRIQVTSPGGTTEAGLRIFQKEHANELFSKVLTAAYSRAKELAK